MSQHRARGSMQPAFVLHSRPYRNTSLLVELFTAELGLMGAVARGARRRQSKLRGLMQPFRPLLVSWFGRGELVTLTAAEDQGPPLWFTGQVLASAFYLNELLLRLLQRSDGHPALYRRYEETLNRFAAVDARNFRGSVAANERGPDLQQILRIYEKYLLQELGYGPVLDREAQTGAAIEPELRYRYHHDRGPVEAGSSGVRETGPQGASDGVMVTGRTLIGLAGDVLDQPAMLKEAKRLMRHLLEVHLGARPLGSRTLIEVYATGTGAPLPSTSMSNGPLS